MIDDHATEEISGIEDSIGLKNPSWIIRVVLGIMLVLARSLSIGNGTPSRPMIITRSGFILFSGYDDAPGTDVFVADNYEAT